MKFNFGLPGFDLDADDEAKFLDDNDDEVLALLVVELFVNSLIFEATRLAGITSVRSSFVILSFLTMSMSGEGFLIFCW